MFLGKEFVFVFQSLKLVVKDMVGQVVEGVVIQQVHVCQKVAQINAVVLHQE